MARIGLALEEREREDLSRLKRFKARGREPTPSR
jgi:vacuolar-type H+-ATPase subunit D/Vma8